MIKNKDLDTSTYFNHRNLDLTIFEINFPNLEAVCNYLNEN